jgi:parvulin-like peptidyl-prolyl isomerase
MNKLIRTPLLIVGLLVVTPQLSVALATEPDDVIARVGDEIITFHDLDVTINSSALVGIPIPSPGTPQRTEMRLTLLDKSISADLLYLDALAKGLDKSAVFEDDVQRYSDAILGSMYREEYLIGDLQISDQEIRDYFKKNYAEGTPFTQDVHMAIEAMIRQKHFKEKVATLRERLRQGVDVRVFEDEIAPAGDAERKSTEVVASIDGEPVLWGEVRQALAAPVETADKSRREKLNEFIDAKIMTRKARAAGMEQTPGYQRRLKEFKRSTLVNTNRARLAEKLSPTEEEIRQYFEKNKAKITIPELRKVQMVVVSSREEAVDIKKQLGASELTFFQAAAKYSIEPNAKMNLGEIGWVPKGSGFEELDKVTFALKPDEVGGPVESPAGWHLVKVVDVRKAEYDDIDDRSTWTKARRLLMHERENDYVVELRKNTYPVKVYEDVFSRLTQQEVDAVNAKQANQEAK